MLIVGVLCIVAAVVAVAFGVRTLRRPLTGDPEQLVLRAVAPAQLAAGLILGVGGVIAMAGSAAVGLLAVMISVTGALGTLAAGSWQGARFAARQQELALAGAAAGGGGCGGECGCSGGAPAEEAAPEPAAPVSMPDAMLGSIMLSGAAAGGASAGGGCGDGCGCSGGGEPAPSPAAGGCGDGCGCG